MTHDPADVSDFEPFVDESRLRRDVEFLSAHPRSRRRAPDIMLRAESYVSEELVSAGWQVERQPFDLRWRIGATDQQGHRAIALKPRLHRRLQGANLIASLPGADNSTTVLIGAHLDSVDGSPGADDNASGVAAVLEIARLLARLPVAPSVSLALFDMEELGLIGAQHAARVLTSRQRVSGMICLESVGYFVDEPDTQRLPAGFSTAFPGAAAATEANGFRGNFTLVVHRKTSTAAARSWERAAAATSTGLPSILLRDPRPDGLLGMLIGLVVPPANHLGRSDHAPFWNRRIPAVMLTDTANFRNPNYHRPTDVPDTLDFRRLAAVTAATATTAVNWV
ncbi:M28 family peptidase [Streptomyces pseudovenezuelae]|uniref:Zn-dependent M28 family amino/carboxypeptidase n=1 Tax=Streptomyces pseudovenezuelae TaxID=67350 RepID=A0ABT6LQX4_9ACTN|nr:M28 family peptidase [Streptomyces pseudovenezuelae]MDH6218671.1 Zn-dependent M28 family amino/carboxypeptidase [Streptomyces pseudovenezuelae]